MVQKKFNPKEIDEESFIASIKNSSEKPEKEKEEVKEQKPTKRKQRQKESDYITLFLADSGIKARSGKLTYIRPEYHERILKIVRVIGNDEISIFNYIDNVLTQHFEEFQEEIIKRYKEKNKDIF